MRALLARDRLVAFVVLSLVAVAYFAPLLAGRQMGHGYLLYDSVPWQASKPPGLDANEFNQNRDVAVQNYPWAELARHQVDQGEAPLWNPSSYAGTPLLGNLQSALAYPLTWLSLLFSFESALGWICVLKLVTAGFGTYLLARTLRIRAGPALVSALVYMLCAPLVAWLQTPLGTVMTLLPWLFLTTERLRRRPSPRRFGAVALVVALSIFAGHPETGALSSSAAGVYLLAALWGERLRAALRTFAAFVGAHLLGVVAAAVVLVPFLLALGDSVSLEVHGGHSSLTLPPGSGLVLFLPNVFGDGLDYRGPLFFYLSVAGYFGAAAMLLAAVGAWLRRSEPYVRGLLAAAVVALMVIFSIPPVSWLIPHIPPYSSSLNVRVFHVVALAGAVLAGTGLDALLRRPLPYRRIALLAGGLLGLAGVWFIVQHLRGALPAEPETELRAIAKLIVFAALGALVLALAGRARSHLAVGVAALVVVLDLAYLIGFNPLLPPEKAYPPKPPVVGFLHERPGPFRITPSKPTAGSPGVFPPNTPALYGLEAPQGYDYPQSLRWARFSRRVLRETGAPSPEFPGTAYGPPRGAARTALQLMNVRYYVAPPDAAAPGPGLARMYAGDDASVYEDRAALPRAYLVPATRRMEDAAALDLLARGGLDPRRAAIVPPGAPAARGDRFQPLRPRRLGPTHWRIPVPPGAGGGLVLADSYSPEWKAEVDGRDVELHPTNYAATGLALPRGARTVDIQLNRARVHLAAGLTVVGLVVIALLMAVGPRLGRMRPGSPGNGEGSGRAP